MRGRQAISQALRIGQGERENERLDKDIRQDDGVGVVH